MGRGSGCVSLYDLICSIVVRGSVCVVWDVDRSFGPVDFRVDFLQPGCPQDDIFISTIDDVEQDSVDDSFDVDKCGGDELDNSGFIVRSVHVSGTDWLGKAVIGYLVFLDKAPVEAID